MFQIRAWCHYEADLIKIGFFYFNKADRRAVTIGERYFINAFLINIQFILSSGQLVGLRMKRI